MMEDPNFTNIRDYWDDATMTKTIDLLHELQDLFLTKFLEMKGILGDLGEMKIPLMSDVKPIKKPPYRLNPRYKE